MRIIWANSAIEHLQAIQDYIAQTSPQYARRMVDRITKRSKQIAAFPLSGRVVPEYERPQIREVIESQYRILYHVQPDRVEVVAVVHSKQHIPSVEEQE